MSNFIEHREDHEDDVEVNQSHAVRSARETGVSMCGGGKSKPLRKSVKGGLLWWSKTEQWDDDDTGDEGNPQEYP